MKLFDTIKNHGIKLVKINTPGLSGRWGWARREGGDLIRSSHTFSNRKSAAEAATIYFGL